MRPVSVRSDSDAMVRVGLHGEIDAEHSKEILNEIRAAIEQYLPREVKVDLSEVTFMDTSGMATLIGAMNASHEVGAHYQLTGVSEQVGAKLRMTGLAELFGLPDVDPP
jgi:anti-anti-sigma factor